jgi:hypothetical protein
MGRREAHWRVPNVAPQELVEEAKTQGVLALAAQRLQHPPPATGGPTPASARLQLAHTERAFTTAAREEAMFSMLLEQGAREVLLHMEKAGMPGLLLKGSALAYWAYEQPHLRQCKDVDLLLSSQHAAHWLADQLKATGYQRHPSAAEPVAYELMCSKAISPEWALEVDIHWQLCNSALFARTFSFDELMHASIPLPALGAHARALGPVHALVHACMHRALNLATGWEDDLKWLYDLVVLMDGLSDADWVGLTELAQQKGLAGVVLSALASAADTFEYALPAAVVADLRQAAASEPLDAARLTDWRYMQWQTFRALKGRRLRWLWQRLFLTQERLSNRYGEGSSFVVQIWLRLKNAIKRVVT